MVWAIHESQTLNVWSVHIHEWLILMVDVQVNKLNKPIHWMLLDVGFRKSWHPQLWKIYTSSNSMDFFFGIFPHVSFSSTFRGNKKHTHPQKPNGPRLNGLSPGPGSSAAPSIFGLGPLQPHYMPSPGATLSDGKQREDRFETAFSLCGWHI